MALLGEFGVFHYFQVIISEGACGVTQVILVDDTPTLFRGEGFPRCGGQIYWSFFGTSSDIDMSGSKFIYHIIQIWSDQNFARQRQLLSALLTLPLLAHHQKIRLDKSFQEPPKSQKILLGDKRTWRKSQFHHSAQILPPALSQPHQPGNRDFYRICQGQMDKVP